MSSTTLYFLLYRKRYRRYWLFSHPCPLTNWQKTVRFTS